MNVIDPSCGETEGLRGVLLTMSGFRYNVCSNSGIWCLFMKCK